MGETMRKWAQKRVHHTSGYQTSTIKNPSIFQAISHDTNLNKGFEFHPECNHDEVATKHKPAFVR